MPIFIVGLQQSNLPELPLLATSQSRPSRNMERSRPSPGFFFGVIASSGAVKFRATQPRLAGSGRLSERGGEQRLSKVVKSGEEESIVSILYNRGNIKRQGRCGRLGP